MSQIIEIYLIVGVLIGLFALILRDMEVIGELGIPWLIVGWFGVIYLSIESIASHL